MQHGSCDAAMSGLGQTKFRGDQRMSAIASKPDISRFLSTRPSTTLADLAIELRDRIHKSVFQ
jgi:hypothetical protein